MCPTVSIVAVALVLTGATVRADGPSGADYQKDIKPILARQCVSCHGAEKPRAALRLDTAAAAIRGGGSGPAVVPGKPDESELLLAVLGEGSGERMPLKRPPLAKAEIERIRLWIAAGAPPPSRRDAFAAPASPLGLRPSGPSGTAGGPERGCPQPD